MNEFVKNKINLKLQTIVNDVSKIIDKRKNNYNCHLASKLNNPPKSAKTYW